MSDHVSRAHLLTHLRRLEGERHPYFSPDRHEAAQRYVLDHWRALGFSCALDEFSYMGQRFVNLVARPQPHAPGPRLILGAHVDTVPGTPGADDNASGIAVLLEASRLAAAHPGPLSVEFVAFTLEELGMIGSTHYAEGLRRSRAPVLGMLSLEMVGFTETRGLQRYPPFLRKHFPAQGTYLGLAANGRSRRLLDQVTAAMRTVERLPVETLVLPGSGRWFPESRLSDHAPFWDRGFPALLVTDTAFFRNPHYHQPSDTVDTLDLAFLEQVCRGVVVVIEKVGKQLGDVSSWDTSPSSASGEKCPNEKRPRL